MRQNVPYKSILYDEKLISGYRHVDSGSLYKNGKDIRNAINQTGLLRTELFLTSKISPVE